MRFNHVLLSVLVVGIVAQGCGTSDGVSTFEDASTGDATTASDVEDLEDSKVVFIQSDGGNGSGDAGGPPSAPCSCAVASDPSPSVSDLETD